MSKFSCHLLIALALLASLLSSRSVCADENTFADAAQLYQTSQWQQAAAAFDRLSRDGQQEKSTRLTAQLYAGESLVQLDRLAEARQRYKLVVQQGPPARLAAQAFFRLGEVAWLAGEQDEAQRLLEAYVRDYPQGDSISYAETYLQQIRQRVSLGASFAALDEAVSWQRKGRYDTAIAAYRKLLKQQSTQGELRAETLRRAAQLHQQLAESKAALELYQQLLVEFPHTKHAAEVQLAVAWLFDQLDQTTQAADQFRGVCLKFPQSTQAAEAAYWLALRGADKQDNGQAMHDLESLLEREKLSAERPELWAKALCLKCQLLSAEDEWQQVADVVETNCERVNDGPLKTKLEFWSAEALFRLRRYDTSREQFDALQPKTIGIGKPWAAMVPLRRAQLAARKQLWSEVLKILDQLEQEHPEFEFDYEIDYLRGRALAGRGKMTAARKFYRRVVENQAAIETEAATMAGWMIGETYFHQHDYLQARRAYQAVMDKTSLPEWQSRSALQAGKCWELEQRWDEASNVYQEALERWPNSQSEDQLTSRLRWAKKQTHQQNQQQANQSQTTLQR